MTFGGFTKLSWDIGGWKTDTKAFVFSINNRKKYPVQTDSSFAIYADSDHGPWFGITAFSISNNSN